MHTVEITRHGAPEVLSAAMGERVARIEASQRMRRRPTLTGSTLRKQPVAIKASLALELHDAVWRLLEAGRLLR